MTPELRLTLGMPYLGRNNLSESSLLKAIGDDRWRQIQDLGQVPTAQIRDDAGSRLYATFYFIELHLSPRNPLSAYGENDVLTFTTDISHYEKVYLDGRHVIAGHPEHWIRTSNVFIYQERGPSKLSVSIPATMDFTQIPQLETQPDSLDLCRQAKTNGVFWNPCPEDIPLFDGKKEHIYYIDSDRDLNGAGLVYFANFISILDRAEREILSGLSNPVPTEVLDARSTYQRRVGYYGNAQCTDRLHISLAARMRLLPGTDGGGLLDLGIDYQVRRSSDNKEILISSCRKVAPLDSGPEAQHWAEAQYARR
jgi:probable biosynthetic protein (TIGR04098 family)